MEKPVASWFRSILSEPNGTGSTRRCVLALVVLATLLLCGIHVWERGLDVIVKDILIWMNSTLALLLGHSKMEERKAAADALQAGQAPPGAPEPRP